MAYAFPKQISVGGANWTLLYDPGNPNTILPDLTTPKVQNVSGQWVKVNNAKLFMVIVDLVYPAVTRPTGVSPARYVRGMRVFNTEVNPETVPPQEMVMYIREVTPGESHQEFFNAVLGQSIQENIRPINTNWAEDIIPDDK